jgi:hypothetical protein
MLDPPGVIPSPSRSTRAVDPKTGQRIKFDIKDAVYASAVWAQDELLTLQSTPAVTLPKDKFKRIGHWESSSFFLGLTSSGDYYVKNMAGVSSSDKPSWYGLGNQDPVGLFFDSDESEPFLVLRKLNPMTLKPGDGGKGYLLRSAPTVRAEYP